MKKQIIALILPILAVCSCTKSDTTDPMSGNGYILFKNNSSNPYAVYINGALFHNVPGGGTDKALEPAGTYNLEEIQLSGYAFYPTDIKTIGTVTATQTLTVAFP